MFLIGHAAIGATVVGLAGIQNPAVAFAVGWVSHYLGDLIPHGDEAVGEWTDGPNGVRRLAALVGIDTVIIAGVLALFVSRHGYDWPLIAAAVGATGPDFLWGLERLVWGRAKTPVSRFHMRIHNYFGVRLPLVVGLVFQTVLTVGLWWRLVA